jgi:hypothetical protein
MEATRLSETSVYIKPTGRHIPEDGVLQTSNPTPSFMLAVSIGSYNHGMVPGIDHEFFLPNPSPFISHTTRRCEIQQRSSQSVTGHKSLCNLFVSSARILIAVFVIFAKTE